MSPIPYNSDAFARMHSNSASQSSKEDSEDTHDEGNLIHSLEDLLRRTREANEATKNRIPLEEFLADLKKKENKAEEVRARTIEIAAERIIGAIQAGVFGEHARLKMAVFSSQETQTANEAAISSSRETQTDENSPYMQDLIKKVQREAFRAGFEAASMLKDKEKILPEKMPNDRENMVTEENGKLSDKQNEPLLEPTNEQRTEEMGIEQMSYGKKPEKLVLPEMLRSDPFQSLLNLARHNSST